MEAKGMIAPSPTEPWPMEAKLRTAREKLKAGAGLKEAAAAAGVSPAKLDLMLWKTMGSKQ
jgi:hypothetical protein